MLSCAQLVSGLCVLLELRLENYAVIDHLAVQFAPGLNLLSGETGAGKSILIDALALLMGEKASPEVIRFGSDRAVISAVFEVDGAAEQVVAGILENNGIDSDEANLILRREIAAKGRVFVNNQPATVAVLKQLAPHLAGIHAQNESLVSFDPGVRLELLDNYANTQLAPVKESFEKWKQVKERISELEQGEHDRLRLVDLWMFQRREIEDAKIQPGEDERMEQKGVLANAENTTPPCMHSISFTKAPLRRRRLCAPHRNIWKNSSAMSRSFRKRWLRSTPHASA
jgi:DNA repair protein RecN (Recombination protein N)